MPLHRRLWRQLRGKIRSFWHLSRYEQIWFFPVWCLLGVSKALIFSVSFKRLAPLLGYSSGPHPWIPLLTPEAEFHARRIGRLIRLAARYTPWDSNCFPQAMVARMLLGWRGIAYALFFGLARDSVGQGQMAAHAWLAAGRVNVVGGLCFERFVVVGCFVGAPFVL
ncbi:MAG: hypothetical protein H6R15_52 [Proteobacteria bacterium]|nr:hypothetical protein [Pseudomonadota bacterium]